jgi:hypothetical protein
VPGASRDGDDRVVVEDPDPHPHIMEAVT